MIDRELFGNTGHASSRVIFGGVALSKSDKADSDCTLEFLLQQGVNHIDTAADYGRAEENIGRWMGRHRKDFFLATKISGRTAAEAKDSIQRSLERLRVDSVDLLQLHNLVDPVEWRRATSADGALEAAIEAREKGWTKYLGVTGHGMTAPMMHLRSLDRFPFDTVLLPCNYMLFQDESYRHAFDALVTECRRRGVAVQTIKSIAQGRWDRRPGAYNTWYVPLTDPADIDCAVQWVLGQSSIFLISAGDLRLLPNVLDAAERFVAAPDDAVMKQFATRAELTPLFP